MPESQDILSIGFDYKQTESDAAKVLASMKEVLATAERLNSVKLSLGSTEGFATSKKSAEELSQILKEQARVIDEYKEKVRQATTTTQARTKATRELTLEEAKVNEQIKKNNTEIRNQAKDAIAATSSLEKLRTELALATTRRNQLPIDSEAFQEAQKEVLGLTTRVKELEAASGDYRRNVGNYASAFTGYANTLRGLRGPTKLVGEALGLGAQEADQFRIVIEHAFQGIAAFFRGKEAKAASEAKDTLATASNTVAQTANTTAAEAGTVAQTELAVATTATSTAMTVFRYALIATGIGVVIGLIALIVVRYKEWKKAIDETSESQKLLSKALEESSFTEAISNVNKLADNIKLAKEGFISKTGALKEYNETIGKTTGEVKTLDEAEAALVKNGPAYIQMLYYQSAAHLALESSAKKAVEAEQIRQKKLEQFSGFIDAQNNFNITSEEDAARAREAIANKEKARRDKEAAEKQKGAEEDLKLFNTFNEKAAEISKKMNFDFFGGKFDEKKKKDIKTIADELRELENELKAIQAEQDNGILTIHEADVKRAEKIKGTIEDIFKLKASDADKNKAAFDLNIRLNPISIRLLEDQVAELSKKLFSSEKAPAFAELDKKLRDIIIKNTTEQIQKITNLSDAGYAHDLENLKSYLNVGFITQKEYEDRVEKLKDQKKRSEIGNAIALDEALISNLRARSDGSKESTDLIAKYEDDLNNQKAKLYELDAANNEKSEAKKLRDAEKYANARARVGKLQVELAQESARLLETLVTASIDNQIRAIESLESSQQKNYDNEKSRIQSSTLTQQKKDEAILKLDAQRQSQKERNDEKERELNNKRAKFERAAAAAKIVADTASAEVGALAYLSNPLTAPLYPAIAALIAGIGALQLATLFATPLPKYAGGLKNNPKGHYGEYGEAGAELIDIPGQKPFIADSSTVAWIPKGTNITPLGRDEINSVMYRTMGKSTAQMIAAKTDNSEEILMSIHREIKKSNSKRNSFQFNFKHDPSWTAYKSKYYS